MTRFWRGPESERGQAIVLISIVMLAMLMSVGLAIDAGQLYVARRTAQEAADAGAYAAAVVLYEGGVWSDAQSAATSDVARNGYTDNGDGGRQKVTVGHSSIAEYNNDSYVQVDITVQVATSLVPQQSGLTSVSVHAIAGAVPLNKGFGIMALDRGSTQNALEVDNTGVVTVTGAGILVNSSAPSYAAYDNCASGGGYTGCPNIKTSSAVDVNGGWTGSGWQVTPTSGYPQQADPFAGYPKPVIGTLPTWSAGNLPAVDNSTNPPTVTLQPGVYTVAIDYAGRVNATFTSGTYILEKGMNGSGNLDVTTGPGGIFVFNTLTNYPNSGAGDTCGSVTFTGNASTSLVAETTGPYAGLLFYQDPACTRPFTISGNGSLTATGTVYVPQGQVVLNGSNASFNGSQIVAKTVRVQSGTVNVTFDAGLTAQPKLPRLVK